MNLAGHRPGLVDVADDPGKVDFLDGEFAFLFAFDGPPVGLLSPAENVVSPRLPLGDLEALGDIQLQ